MQDEHGDDVAIFVVYLREAHPTDGRQSDANVRDKILVAQPKTIKQRTRVATEMCTKLDLSIPALIDGLDDRVGKAYNAMPDRLYLIGKNGRIAYQGDRGPRGFNPAELDKAILIELLSE
jgi:hypothetical protein